MIAATEMSKSAFMSARRCGKSFACMQRQEDHLIAAAPVAGKLPGMQPPQLQPPALLSKQVSPPSFAHTLRNFICFAVRSISF